MASTTEMSFLYQTRTILRPSSWPSRWTRRLFHQNMRLFQAEQSTIARPDGHEVQLDSPRSFLQEKAQAVSVQPAKSGVASTMTPAERYAFRKLHRIAEEVQFQSHQPDAASNLRIVDPEQILALFTSTTTKHSPPEIEISSSTPVSHIKENVSDNSDPEQSATENQSTPEAGPGELPHSSDLQAQSDQESLIHNICLSQLKTTNSHFRAALTPSSASLSETNSTTTSSITAPDILLWTALETYVFPLIYHLSAADKQSKNRLKRANVALPLSSLLQSSTSSAAPTGNNTNTNNPKSLALPIITRLFPASLLLALRLFSIHTPLSPYASALIPQLRSFGAASYILGASTNLYNTLLSLRWSTYSNLREMCNLLSEMERGGVEFDRGTYNVLETIREERAREMGGSLEGGSTGATGGRRPVTWWQRPEQVKWFAPVEEWRDVIARRLVERGEGVVLREGPNIYTNANVSSEMDFGGRSGGKEGSAVWL